MNIDLRLNVKLEVLRSNKVTKTDYLDYPNFDLQHRLGYDTQNKMPHKLRNELELVLWYKQLSSIFMSMKELYLRSNLLAPFGLIADYTRNIGLKTKLRLGRRGSIYVTKYITGVWETGWYGMVTGNGGIILIPFYHVFQVVSCWIVLTSYSLFLQSIFPALCI